MVTKTSESAVEAIENAKSFFEKGTQANLIFALCDVLDTNRETLAARLGVTRGQINHYRKSETNLSDDKLSIVISLLHETIEGLQFQIKELKASGPKNKLSQAVSRNLQSRIDIANETLNEHMLSQKKALEKNYKSLEKLMRGKKK